MTENQVMPHPTPIAFSSDSLQCDSLVLDLDAAVALMQETGQLLSDRNC